MQIYGEYPISDLCQTDNILLASNDYHKNADKIFHVITFPVGTSRQVRKQKSQVRMSQNS